MDKEKLSGNLNSAENKKSVPIVLQFLVFLAYSLFFNIFIFTPEIVFLMQYPSSFITKIIIERFLWEFGMSK